MAMVLLRAVSLGNGKVTCSTDQYREAKVKQGYVEFSVARAECRGAKRRRGEIGLCRVRQSKGKVLCREA